MVLLHTRLARVSIVLAFTLAALTAATATADPTPEAAAAPLPLPGPPRQICVPVVKNNSVPPPDVLAIARWVDLEKFTASPATVIAPFSVMLHHLNPLLVGLPAVPVTLQRASALMVPVAKNGALPPPL
jgi:hypothetical protein